MSERQYKDASGNPCNLLWLVKNEPEWAENQIRHRDKLERELADAKARIARLEEAGDVMAGRLSILAEFRRDEIMVKNWNISKTSLKEAQP